MTFDLENKIWAKIKVNEVTGFPRYSHSMVAYENYLVIFGGIC
jgi:hypothetical protein